MAWKVYTQDTFCFPGCMPEGGGPDSNGDEFEAREEAIEDGISYLETFTEVRDLEPRVLELKEKAIRPLSFPGSTKRQESNRRMDTGLCPFRLRRSEHMAKSRKTQRRHLTVTEIIEGARAHESHFFEKSTMRFFCSRVYAGETWLDLESADVYFITSERFERPGVRGPRRYTVRKFLPETGEIETVGLFQEHATLRDAKSAARDVAGMHKTTFGG